MARNTLTQDNPTIPQVVQALRESMQDGSMDPTSRSLVVAACKQRGVPIKDGRILWGADRFYAATIYFAVRALIERGGVRVGQRWASKDKRDVERRHNQARQVEAIRDGYAFLTSESVPGAFGVRIKHGAVTRHRLVEDVA